MAKRTKDNLKVYDEKDELKILEDRQKLEEKRLAFIEKLKESEQKGGKNRNKTVVSSKESSGEPISDKQRRADKKLMAKYDMEVDDADDVDVKCEVISADKQILDRDGYKAREEARRRELKEKYKGREKPTDLKADKRDKINIKSKHGHDRHKDKHKHSSSSSKRKDKHKHKHKHRDREQKDIKDRHKLANKEIKKGPPKPKFIRPNTQGRQVLSFQDLLKLANQKHEAVLKPEAAAAAAPKKPEVKPDQKPAIKMPDRPMTQEEKERYLRRHTKEYQTWLQKGGKLSIGQKVEKEDSDSDEADPKPAPRNDKLKNESLNSKPLSGSQGKPSLDSSQNRREESAPRDRPRPQSSRPGLSAVPSRQPVGGGRPTPPSGTSSQGKSQASRLPQANTAKSSTLAGAKRDSSGGTKGPAPQEAHTNPFDRIMGQIKKNNPKPG